MTLYPLSYGPLPVRRDLNPRHSRWMEFLRHSSRPDSSPNRSEGRVERGTVVHPKSRVPCRIPSARFGPLEPPRPDKGPGHSGKASNWWTGATPASGSGDPDAGRTRGLAQKESREDEFVPGTMVLGAMESPEAFPPPSVLPGGPGGLVGDRPADAGGLLQSAGWRRPIRIGRPAHIGRAARSAAAGIVADPRRQGPERAGRGTDETLGLWIVRSDRGPGSIPPGRPPCRADPAGACRWPDRPGDAGRSAQPADAGGVFR